jgi:hypothetical protein
MLGRGLRTVPAAPALRERPEKHTMLFPIIKLRLLKPFGHTQLRHSTATIIPNGRASLYSGAKALFRLLNLPTNMDIIYIT